MGHNSVADSTGLSLFI